MRPLSALTVNSVLAVVAVDVNVNGVRITGDRTTPVFPPETSLDTYALPPYMNRLIREENRAGRGSSAPAGGLGR